MRENIQTAIEEALNSAPERKFIETVEFSFNLKDVDLKNPANRIQEEIRLPAGRGKPIKIAMFAGGEMATKARAAGIDIIDPTTIEDLGGNPLVSYFLLFGRLLRVKAINQMNKSLMKDFY